MGPIINSLEPFNSIPRPIPRCVDFFELINSKYEDADLRRDFRYVQSNSLFLF